MNETLTIETGRFGALTVDNTTVIEFIQPLLGFEQFKRFVLIKHQEDSPFEWLQSVDDGDLAFVITHPNAFGLEFTFEIPDEIVEKLVIQSPEALLVWCLVTIPEDNPAAMTANLVAPVVINTESMKAAQLVLNDSPYQVKTRLIPDFSGQTV